MDPRRSASRDPRMPETASTVDVQRTSSTTWRQQYLNACSQLGCEVWNDQSCRLAAAYLGTIAGCCGSRRLFKGLEAKTGCRSMLNACDTTGSAEPKGM